MIFTKYVITNCTPMFRPKGTLYDLKQIRNPTQRSKTRALVDKLTEAFGEPISHYTGNTLKNQPIEITGDTWFIRRADFSTTISLTSEAQMQYLVLTMPNIRYKDVVTDHEI